MTKLDADDPLAGTIDDPNVEDPYADLRARNAAAKAATEKPARAAKAANTETSTAPKKRGGKK